MWGQLTFLAVAAVALWRPGGLSQPGTTERATAARQAHARERTDGSGPIDGPA